MLRQILSAALLMGWAAHAQPQGPTFEVAAAFEVATIRPAPPITAAMAAAGQFHVGMKTDKQQVDIGYSSLADVIRIAYEVKTFQISGPDWMSDQKWDVLAKIPDGAPPSEIPHMLQALLRQRFGLKVHRETKERPVYGLEIAKGGAKLKQTPSNEGELRQTGEEKPLQVATSRDGNSSVVTGAGRGITRTEMRPDGSMHFESSKMTPAMLAEALAFYLDRPVVDLTQLPGSYVVELEFSAADLRYAAAKTGGAAYLPPAVARNTDSASDPVGVSLVASVQKLGLKLEPQQAPIEIIVVDHAEKAPSAN